MLLHAAINTVFAALLFLPVRVLYVQYSICLWILIGRFLLSVCLSRCSHPDCCWCRDDGGRFPWLLWCHPRVSMSAGNCESQSHLKDPVEFVSPVQLCVEEQFLVLFTSHVHTRPCWPVSHYCIKQYATEKEDD